MPYFALTLSLMMLAIALAGCAAANKTGALCTGGDSDRNTWSCLELRTWNQPPPNGGIDEKSGPTPTSTVQ